MSNLPTEASNNEPEHLDDATAKSGHTEIGSNGEGQEAPIIRADFLFGAIVLALLFFLTPYMFGSSGPDVPGRSDVVGAKLVGDGFKLVTGHEVLVGLHDASTTLGDTLTAPWWGQINPEQKLWRPLPLFVLGVGSSLAGPYYEGNPGSAGLPFHILVLAFHVLATMLLFSLTFEFTKNNTIALIAAALFATLPVHGEAIFDIAGIAELMAAAFSFGAWLCWLKAGSDPLKNIPMLASSLGLVALAALSKESAFMLPVLFFLVDAGRNPQKSGLDFGFALKKLPALGALVTVLAVIIGIRMSIVGGLAPDFSVAQHVDNPLIAASGLDRISNGMRLLIASIPVMLGINPFRGDSEGGLGELFGFSADYSMGQIEVLGAFSMWNLISIIVLLGTIATAFTMSKKCGLRAGLWLALLGSLLLSSNILFPIGTIFAERLLYFPSGLLVIVIAIFLARFAKAGLIAGVAIAVLGGTWTYARADAWTSSPNFFKQIQVDAPNSAKAAFYAGLEFEASDLFGTAATKYRKAVEIFPNYSAAETRLGFSLEQDLKYDEAIEHYVRSLEIQLEASDWKYIPEPDGTRGGSTELIVAITNLRVYNDAVAQVQENLDWFDSLIARGYDSPILRTMRARTLLNLARAAEAEDDYKASLDIEPTGLAVLYYGELLRKKGRNAEALALYDANSKLTDAFNGTELVEFLLQRADAELLSDPTKAIATVQTAKEHVMEMSAEQVFRTRWTWTQATLDTMPQDPLERAEKFLEIESELKVALSAYTIANETTYAARYTLANVMFTVGHFADLIPLAEEMLQFRSTPILRTWLAQAYTETGEPEKAIENISAACAELVTEDGTAIDLQQLLTARRSFIQMLTLAGRYAEVSEAIAGWHALTGGEDMWTLALASDWAAGWDDITGAAALSAHLATTYPNFPDGAKFATMLASYANPQADYAAKMGLAGHRFGWGNLPGAIESSEAALALASTDIERADTIGILANALANMSRIDEAIARLDEALSLSLPAEYKANIQKTRDQMAAQ